MSIDLSELNPALGQFDDADTPSALEHAKPFDPREGQNFIDEDDVLEWTEDEDGVDEDEDEELWRDSEIGGVDDEDWEIADRGRYIPISLMLNLIALVTRFH